MDGLKVSGDTSAFEVAAVLDGAGRLTEACARAALARMEAHGLVILTGLLSDAEADRAAGLIRETIDDPARNRCAFASQTDNRYRRRDFCSLPATPGVMGFAAMLARRLEEVVSHYCAPDHPLLEVTTLTSYAGSSHQYVHRDPSGVISLFAAVEDVSAAQGGTVFVPGTQVFADAAKKHDAAAEAQMELVRARWNVRILSHNLKKLWAMRNGRETPLAPGEFRDRVFSTHWDEHQPNLLRFLIGKNPLFSVRTLTPGTVWRLIREGRALDARFPVVGTAPRKGTVILYQSDMLHAGPDNRSATPRRLFSMSIAREAMDEKRWHAGYSPHPGLIERPTSFGDLLTLGQAAEGAMAD
ncbi:hypothetical protein ACNI3Q_04625 [Sphingomonas sp. FW199]|uniref:hypothetical protein n=1 Tax=Sphingomonas sp. FW199 TaxID=3400217 RepID=UPI003CF7A77C